MCQIVDNIIYLVLFKKNILYFSLFISIFNVHKDKKIEVKIMIFIYDNVQYNKITVNEYLKGNKGSKVGFIPFYCLLLFCGVLLAFLS